MKNVLFITHYSELYGANKSLLVLLDGLKNEGFFPFVIIPHKGSIETELGKRNIPFLICPIPIWAINIITIKSYARFMRDSIKAIFFISSFIRKNKVNLIYTNSSISPIGIILSTIFGIPHILHIREFVLLHYDLKFLFPQKTIKKIMLMSKAIICISKAIKDYYFPGSLSSIHVIYNGVKKRDQIVEIIRNPTQKHKSDEFTFAIIGLISKKKGQIVAIEAFEKINRQGMSSKLLLIGNGHEDDVLTCKKLVKEFKLEEKVQFLGYVDNPFENIEFDCLLMCSDYEAMGRVTAEALSHGIPVIGRNSGGTPELIKHNFNGFLFDSTKELVRYMEYLVKNPDISEQLSINGLSTALEMFTEENYSNSVSDVISSAFK